MKRFDSLQQGFAIPLVLVLGFVAPALATPVTWTGSQGDLSASATFEVLGDDLVVTLSNVSTADVLVPVDVLTAVFFDLESSVGLTQLSAFPGGTSTVHFGGTDGDGSVGGEWALADGLSGAPGDGEMGISSVGLGLFGPGDLFPGDNLDGPDSPDGLNYGLTSFGDDVTTGNAPVTGDNPLVQHEAIFTLDGWGALDPLAEIGNVWFQYGTDLSEPSFPGVPEPSTLILLGVGVVGLGIRRVRGS